jgi:hypothetical protein
MYPLILVGFGVNMLSYPASLFKMPTLADDIKSLTPPLDQSFELN